MVDKISSLPDELLCHILSFLPTQDAVVTSVLSKRWRHLWTAVPVLDYNNRTYRRNIKPSCCFERFVYGTILARDVHQHIRRFSLKYGGYGSQLSGADVIPDHNATADDVNAWVSTAIQRGIENLDIEIFPRNYKISLRCCIFSCRTLVVLKLKGLSLKASYFVDLPSLKSLHLEAVKFVKPQHLMELIYGCPVLEDLRVFCLDYYPVDDYYCCKEELKSLPKLARADLVYVGMDHTNILLKAVCNVEFLTIIQFPVVDEIPEFPHLRRLTLFLDIHHWNLGFLMLKNFPKLQSFILDLRGSSEAEDVLPYQSRAVPECHALHLKRCSLICYGYGGPESGIQFAKYILQNSTSLQSMKIHCISSSALAKHEMLNELALCSRKSASCKLSVD